MSGTEQAGLCNAPQNSQGREHAGPRCIKTEQSELYSRCGSDTICHKSVQSELGEDQSLVLTPEDMTHNSPSHQLGQTPGEMVESSAHEPLEPTSADVTENRTLDHKKIKTLATPVKRKYLLRSSLEGSTRVLRSRSAVKNKIAEPINDLVNIGSRGERLEKKRKQKRRKVSGDEFSKARKHLKYLLHRISYEQNLVDVYSGEGWKGQSVEKIKLEKELQRAKGEIFRCKLRIRELFQHVDSFCAEGRLPDSLFDDEGQIDSEDIFCVKCASKDVTAKNDIILCDGVCERAFHQFCLEPPLIIVPAGDEGWLCPGCDCKADCIDLLNESQGTNISIDDNWEMVFPEAAAAAETGNHQKENCEFPSDDSDDNDFDPDGLEVDGKRSLGEEPRSSDSTSASADSEVSCLNQKHLGIPSDDSEDDDFDPDARESNEQIKPESSSSDFTSDSEDLAAALEDAVMIENPSTGCSRFSRRSGGRRSKADNENMMNDESLPVPEIDRGVDDSATLSGRRLIERLDYKKLYDETYGNNSDSSDDEDWTDAGVSEKFDIEGGNSSSPKRNSPMQSIGMNIVEANQSTKDIKESSTSRTRRKLSRNEANKFNDKLPKDSSGPGSGSGKRRTYKKFGEAVTEGLCKHFKENQYPDWTTKENLAKEFGLTAKQVSKWFENARWSFFHPSNQATNEAQYKETPKHGPKKLELSKDRFSLGSACNGANGTLVEGQNNGGDIAGKTTGPQERNSNCASDQVLAFDSPSSSADVPKGRGLRSRTRKKKT